MRITFEMEDDSDDEFRVELFTSKKDIQPDEFISLGATALASVRALEDAETRSRRMQEMVDALRPEGHNRGETVIPDPPSEEPRYTMTLDEDEKKE
ncbi:hypothetical protein HWD07_gp048 [Gordonia phage John316]|uniref:Uncharacterized protein n=1 Tax=Gordonia phage John316 TaxID=2708629 RepID=A0A6G6XT10_9CAUD|nr:hypothetical protein HWD07_gp048 [Gordonia phage John316]QIG61962.1 hypothetical protein SEA_JOHN316_86 [Gordonia phage John316]WGH19765.1 hypothetical protein [Gordonia phage Lizzo]